MVLLLGMQLSWYFRIKLLKQLDTSLMTEGTVGPGHASASGGSSFFCWWDYKLVQPL